MSSGWPRGQGQPYPGHESWGSQGDVSGYVPPYPAAPGQPGQHPGNFGGQPANPQAAAGDWHGYGYPPQQPGAQHYQQPQQQQYPQQAPASGSWAPDGSWGTPYPGWQGQAGSGSYGMGVAAQAAQAQQPGGAEQARGAAPGAPRGTPFGRYLLTDELGRGGMGVVYKAYQQELKRYCALKVLQGAEGERLVHEGQSCARLGKHPNIVQVFDAGFVGETAYITMEMVSGTPLDELLKAKGPLEETRVLDIGYKVAVALHHAHRHDLVHRDMKPANVIIDEDGEPHVLDFGLAKDVVEGDTQFAGLVVGTPSYMPPEQFSPETGKVDARADVYALGATLYHLLSGKKPYEGSLRAIMLQSMTQPPQPLRTLGPVSRDLEAVIGRAMEKEPTDRYQTALELADDLSRVMAGEPPKARQLGPLGRTIRRAQRHPALVTLALVLVLFAVAAAVYTRHRAQEMEVLWQGLSQQIAHLSANEARKLLDPAIPLMKELELAADRGLIPLERPDDLAKDLSVRFEARGLDWMTYYDAQGSFVGITRRQGKTIYNRSWLEGDSGWEIEYEVARDGSFSELSRTQHPWDPRTEEDFAAASAAIGPVWVGPHTWEEEASLGAGQEWGVTAAVAVRRDGAVRGVFTADYLLAQLSDFLAKETEWPEARSFLLTREERVFARSDRETGASDPVLAAALAAMPTGLADLPVGEPTSLSFEHQGIRYTAAIEVFPLPGGLEWATAVVAPLAALRGDVDRLGRWLAWAGAAGLVLLVLGMGWSVIARRLRVRRAVAIAAGQDSELTSGAGG